MHYKVFTLIGHAILAVFARGFTGLCFDYVQAGLAPIKERLFRETVGRYGFKPEFTRATTETMREVLAVIRKK